MGIHRHRKTRRIAVNDDGEGAELGAAAGSVDPRRATHDCCTMACCLSR